MIIKNYILLPTIALCCCNCAVSPKPKPSTEASPAIEIEKEIEKPEQDAPEKGGGFTVAFISFGTGTDGAAYAALDKVIVDFRRESKCIINKEVMRWGREGERDVCLSSADESCLNELKKRVVKEIGTNKRVQLKAGATCKR